MLISQTFYRKLENSEPKSNKCDQCKMNLLKFMKANDRCQQLEKTNQKLNEQVKYLLEKIRIQEATNSKADKTDVIQTTVDNQLDPLQPKTNEKLTNESQPNQDESKSNENQSNDEDDSHFHDDGPSGGIYTYSSTEIRQLEIILFIGYFFLIKI